MKKEITQEEIQEIDSYKGGTYGAGHDTNKGETIKQCLKRMMKERKF